MITKNYIF